MEEYSQQPNHTKQTIFVFLFLGVAIVSSFYQLTTWDKFALPMIPIQLRELVGALDIKDHEAKASICLERKFYDCAEQEYATVAYLSQSAAMVFRLAQLQIRRGENKEAAATLETYFRLGGADTEAHYAYAKALAQLGNFDKAAENFELVLRAKPKVLQITVIQNYVKMLFQAGQSDRAMKLVKDVRKKRDDSRFMEQELAQLTHAPSSSERIPAAVH